MESLKLVNGDLVFANDELQMVSGPDELAQCCAAELGTNKGEWFLDPDMGIRFDRFNGKSPDPGEMADEIREGLYRTGRIDSVEDVTVIQDKVNRKQVVSFVATSTGGDQLASGVTVDA